MPSDESLNKLITEAIEKLDSALKEVLKLSREGSQELYQIGKLGRSIGLLEEFQAPIFEKYPELMPAAARQERVEPRLTDEQKEFVSKLSEEQLKNIDNALLSYANKRFQKVAMIVAMFIAESNLHSSEIPDVFYAQRIAELSNKGLLESQGNLKLMRFSEVRIPKT